MYYNLLIIICDVYMWVSCYCCSYSLGFSYSLVRGGVRGGEYSVTFTQVHALTVAARRCCPVSTLDLLLSESVVCSEKHRFYSRSQGHSLCVNEHKHEPDSCSTQTFHTFFLLFFYWTKAVKCGSYMNHRHRSISKKHQSFWKSFVTIKTLWGHYLLYLWTSLLILNICN